MYLLSLFLSLLVSSSPLPLSSFNDTTSAPLNEPIRTSLGGSKEKSPVYIMIERKESSRIIRQSVLQLESSLDQCTNKLRSILISLQKWYILLEQEKELIITEIFKTLRDMDNVLDVLETLSIGLYFNLAEIC